MSLSQGKLMHDYSETVAAKSLYSSLSTSSLKDLCLRGCYRLLLFWLRHLLISSLCLFQSIWSSSSSFFVVWSNLLIQSLIGLTFNLVSTSCYIFSRISNGISGSSSYGIGFIFSNSCRNAFISSFYALIFLGVYYSSTTTALLILS